VGEHIHGVTFCKNVLLLMHVDDALLLQAFQGKNVAAGTVLDELDLRRGRAKKVQRD